MTNGGASVQRLSTRGGYRAGLVWESVPRVQPEWERGELCAHCYGRLHCFGFFVVQNLCSKTAELETCRRERDTHQQTIAVLKEELDRLVQQQQKDKEDSNKADTERQAALQKREAAAQQVLWR